MDKLRRCLCASVPVWDNIYVYSAEDIKRANAEQQRFYIEFKQAFLRGEYFDLQGNTNYCFVLFFDVQEGYKTHRDFERLIRELTTLKMIYNDLTPYVIDVLIKLYLDNKRYAEAWATKKNTQSYSLQDICKFEARMKRSLFDHMVIKDFAGTKGLTIFGQKHIDEIQVLAEVEVRRIEKENNCRFSKQFVKYKKWGDYNLSEYAQYYANKTEYNYYLKIDTSQASFRGGSDSIPHTVTHAVQARLQSIMHQSENQYRVNCGLPKIGEGWIGETELYYFIKDLLPRCSVLQHARPEWLKPQHLDVYIADYNIAIEYQGEQHFTPIEYFGGRDAFEETIQRDAIKAKKCEDNNCSLIYINKTHDQTYVSDIIKRTVQKYLQ